MIASSTQPQETNASYHADHEHISHSMLSVFRQSRKMYHGRFVTGEIPPAEPTDAMKLGTLVHLAVLEPERFEVEVVMAPKCDRRTTVGKQLWAEFCEQSIGKVVVDADTYQIALNVRAAVMASECARHLLEDAGDVEKSIRWRCPETGLARKCRPDKLTERAIIDLKTARDASPQGFANSCARLGYHRQAASYREGVQIHDGDFRPFVFIACETSEPWTVAAYEIDGDAIALGHNQNETSLKQLRDCMKHGDWREPHEKRINLLSLPKWTQYADEYEIFE